MERSHERPEEGKKRTGKLSKTGQVSVQVDTWSAKFTDETGTVWWMPTKTTVRKTAIQIFAQYEKDVACIKTGVTTRAEFDKSQVRHIPLEELFEQFHTKMIADGSTERTIKESLRKITTLFLDCEIDSLAKIRREPDQAVGRECGSKPPKRKTKKQIFCLSVPI